MQCPSCQFQNMPGVAACGRCGARLQLATAVIDVHPPRASPLAKRLRRWVPGRGLAARVRDGWASLLEKVASPLDLPRPVPGVFLRMVVPGWPQIFVNQRARGRLMLGLYLGLMIGALVFVGTPFGSLLLGCALAVHAASVIDILWAATGDWRTRIEYALLCLLVLGSALYWPAILGIGQVVVARRMVLSAPPFAAGDTILCSPAAYAWSEPAVGHIVLFEIPAQQIQGRTAQGGNIVYRVEGEYIDRVLAGPGQKVVWWNGSLVVDGQPSVWRPLNPDAVPGPLHITVPTGYYLLFPSTRPQNAPQWPAEVWARISLIPRHSVRGRAVVRHQPLWRWWWLR